MLGAAEDLSPAALQRRADAVLAQILRDGISHNVLAPSAPTGAGGAAQALSSRPWSLEVLPLVIESADWAVLEAGIRQRAALAQALMADLYGQQGVLREGLLPPSLLLRHPAYLRPLHGLRPPLGLWLHVIAFDVTREPSGRWCLLAQRTQAPSGLGYLLQNRLLVSRQFPQAFQALRVQHVASTYRVLLQSLQAAAAAVAGSESPRLVLWTPGPYSETHFEQAYLARYLGLTLVEGGDLTVRDERLYLQTLHGLEPVHGVLRRLDDDWCDPLELRPDSTLGVPGLLQVLRAGHLAMANMPGSGVLESPALHGFMPGLAQRLLGAPLALPSVDTWWCGEAAAAAEAQAMAEGLRWRRTFPHGARTSAPLSPADAQALLPLDPDAVLAQRPLRYASVPVWGEGRVQSQPALLRVYAVADAQGHWRVLPGGMARVSRDRLAVAGEGRLSMHRGGASLDTWVLADGEPDTYSMLRRPLEVDDLRERRRPVSSRTGEHLFWLGRYTERAEACLPLLRLGLGQASATAPADPALASALHILCLRNGLIPPGTPSPAQAPRVFERTLAQGAFDTAGTAGVTSLGFNLAALERAALPLRERLSTDHWRLIQQLRRAADEPPRPGEADAERLPALDGVALLLAAITGAQTDRMTRDAGWRLLSIGRLLERLITGAQRLAVFLQEGAHRSEPGVDALLELFDSSLTFRARYQRREELLPLADVLVLDETNPRALAGVLRRLRTELGKLPGDPAVWASLLQQLPAQGAGLDLDELTAASAGEAARVRRLVRCAEDLMHGGWGLAESVGRLCFTPAHEVEQRL